jgi:hypothetical protein
MEHRRIYPILTKQLIIACFRHVDDMVAHDIRPTQNTEHTLNEFNELQPSIKFTTEKDLHESINFLHLTIHCKGTNLQL